MLELRHLRSLIAIAESGKLVAAAARVKLHSTDNTTNTNVAGGRG